MNRLLTPIFVLLLLCTPGFCQDLESVLKTMDREADNFKSAQADFAWDQYQEVVKEHDIQQGAIYFRRQKKGVEMAADITSANDRPDQKYVLFKDGLVRVYQPGIAQVTEYDAGKHKNSFETFLVLGFGGSGSDLKKSFDIKYLGPETVQGVATQKLELIPKSQSARGIFNRILLWIDSRGISVQQQFFEPESGNYRLAKYSNIRINPTLSDSVFEIKPKGKVQIVKPQG